MYPILKAMIWLWINLTLQVFEKSKSRPLVVGILRNKKRLFLGTMVSFFYSDFLEIFLT